MSETCALVACPTCGNDAPGCFYCGRPAVLLCDGVWAFAAHEDDITAKLYGRNWIIDVGAEQGDCDRPLCAEHARTVGHTCGEDGCDTIDLCPDCDGRQAGRVPILTAGEMNHERAKRAIRAEATP